MAKSVKFVKSAKFIDDYPPIKLPEVAIIGRSNSGKSSLVNALAGRPVAKVSKTPGKTILLNFFDFEQDFTLVDLPGYGYAKRPKALVDEWIEMIETYLQVRESLKKLYLIMDIDRRWAAEEQMLLEWADQHNKEIAVVLNKVDKANQSQMHHSLEAMKRVKGLEYILTTSAKKNIGISDLFRDIMRAVKLGET